MKKLLIAILSVLLLAAFIPARKSIMNAVRPDTTWKPYIVVLRNEYGQQTSKWVAGYYNPIADTTPTSQFNFNATPQNVPGWIDVSGSPSSSLITATDPKTGWSVTNIAISWWQNYVSSSSNNSRGSTVADTGGYVYPQNVTYSAWYSNTINNDYLPANRAFAKKIAIYGLNQAKLYTVSILSSLDTAYHTTPDTLAKQVNEIRINQQSTPFGSVKIMGNTSVLSTFTNVSPVNDSIYVDVAPTDANTRAIINALVIKQQ